MENIKYRQSYEGDYRNSTRKKEFSESTKKRYKTYYNLLKMKYRDKMMEMEDGYTFIDKYHSVISDHYSNGRNEKGDKYSDDYIKHVYSDLMMFFYINENKRLEATYEDLFRTMRKKIENAMDKNKLSEKKEKEWIYMYEIKNIIDQLKDNETAHENYILLNMLYYKPLRTSYYINLTVEQDAKKTDKTKNYIFISKKIGGKCYYHVADDKVSNTKTHANNNDIELDDELNKILIKSLKDHPRGHLIDCENEKQLQDMINKFLPYHVTISTIRTIYECERFIKIGIIEGNYAKFARECLQLRHDISIVMTDYLKDVYDHDHYRKMINDGINKKLNKKKDVVKYDDEFKNKIINKLDDDEKAYITNLIDNQEKAKIQINDDVDNKRIHKIRSLIYYYNINKKEMSDNLLNQYPEITVMKGTENIYSFKIDDVKKEEDVEIDEHEYNKKIIRDIVYRANKRKGLIKDITLKKYPQIIWDEDDKKYKF